MEVQQIILKEALPSAVMTNPYPAGVLLRFSRVNAAIVVHHPENPKVTKTIRGERCSHVYMRYSEGNIQESRLAFNLLKATGLTHQSFTNETDYSNPFGGRAPAQL